METHRVQDTDGYLLLQGHAVGLKNAGATYQRAMTKIFDDLIHQVVECYVDDLVVKTHS